MILAAILLGVALGVLLALYGCGISSSQSPGSASTRSARSHVSHQTPSDSEGNSSRAQQSSSDQPEEISQDNAAPVTEPGEESAALPQAEPGSVKPPLETTPPELVRGNPRGSQVALTFDAGASAVPTPVILKALDDAGVKVTFFLTGKWCEKNPEMTRKIVAAGHEIANHTYNHKELPGLSDSEIVDELQKADECVYSASGQHTNMFFRPPYGARNKHVLEVAAQAGYRSAYWTLDSWDSVKRDITSAEIEKRVIGKLAAGDIVLMHCGSEPTSQALPAILRAVKSRGFSVVKVSELGE